MLIITTAVFMPELPVSSTRTRLPCWKTLTRNDSLIASQIYAPPVVMNYANAIPARPANTAMA